ncbi:MAG: type II secretion system protein [Clostridia bacterium]|nr:type II secretion system protein [Clostridia bacterium]
MKNRIFSRRGSTLVELIIAMALISIVSVMIVSFSAMANSFAGDEQGKHSFVDECAAIRQDVNDFLLTCDTEKDKNGDTNTINVTASSLSCEAGELKVTLLNDGIRLGNRDLDDVTNITFDVGENKNLLKCTVTCVTEKGAEYEQIFVFALRCATFVEE